MIQAIVIGVCLFLANASARLVETTVKEPEYQYLPPLREQAALQTAWTEERKADIPQILQKYGVDAWLVRTFIN